MGEAEWLIRNPFAMSHRRVLERRAPFLCAETDASLISGLLFNKPEHRKTVTDLKGRLARSVAQRNKG